MKDTDFLKGIRSALQTYAVLLSGDDQDSVIRLLSEVQERISKEKKLNSKGDGSCGNH